MPMPFLDRPRPVVPLRDARPGWFAACFVAIRDHAIVHGDPVPRLRGVAPQHHALSYRCGVLCYAGSLADTRLRDEIGLTAKAIGAFREKARRECGCGAAGGLR